MMGEPSAKSSLPLSLSLYLDVVRFAAALLVVLDHITSYPFTDNSKGPREGIAQLLGSHGAVAVTIFFVLSGYVIAHVVATRERGAVSYAISRLSRLYSVVLPALAITLLLDSIGQALDPEFYSLRKILHRPPSLEAYGATLLFINEWRVFDFGGIAPGTNAPFWSLSFEATYYLAAGLLLFGRAVWTVPLVVGLLLLSGRTVAAMFPLWWIGFALYHHGPAIARRLPMPALLHAGAIAVIIVMPFRIAPIFANNFGAEFPFGRLLLNRNLAQDYLTALAFSVQLLAAQRLGIGQWGLRAAAVIRKLGLATFPLYAIHFPVLAFFSALNPFNRESMAGIAFLIGSVLLVVGLSLPVCEQLKSHFKRLLQRLVTA